MSHFITISLTVSILTLEIGTSTPSLLCELLGFFFLLRSGDKFFLNMILLMKFNRELRTIELSTKEGNTGE